jgi:hypothetical protein
VSLLFGDGTGGFSAPTTLDVGPGPRAVAIGDLNRDGFEDLAVTLQEGDNLAVFLNDGTGAFAGPWRFATGSNPRPVVIADFNRDGKKDVAVGNTFWNSVSIFLNTTP